MPFVSALLLHALRTSIWSTSCTFAVEMHFFGKQLPRLCKCRVMSDTQLIGLGEDNFQNRHESRGLAEVAGADYVRVDI